MFRFSVLLAFLFAALFGPSKAAAFKKKSVRRRINGREQPVVANGLAALDDDKVVLEDMAVRDWSSDSDGGWGRRRKPKGGRCGHCKSWGCRRRCYRKGWGTSSDSD